MTNSKKISGRERSQENNGKPVPQGRIFESGAKHDNNSLMGEEQTAGEEKEIQPKTVTRTFRIYEDLGNSFEKVVSEMNTTQTNLMNEILKQYLYWAQYIINHDSPFLTFGSGTIVSFAESLDDASLEKMIKGISIEEAIDFIKFRWKKVNFRNIVRYLELLSLYSNIGNFNIGPQNGENDVNGNHNGASDGFQKYEIAVRHHLGKRWSTLLAMYISNLFTTSIPATEANYEISNKSCFVYLKMAIRNGKSGT